MPTKPSESKPSSVEGSPRTQAIAGAHVHKSDAPQGFFATVSIPDAHVDEFLNIIEEDVRESRKEMGCLRFDVLNLGGNVFQFYEMYVSKAAIAQHKSTVHFQKWVDFKNRIPGVADSLKITMFEIATSPATYHHSPEPVGAIEHVVVQKLSRPLNPSELEQAHAMKDAVPGMISITCGENYTARGAGYNYGWSTRFVSKEAEADYQQHPAHEKFRKEVIMPLLVRDGGGSGVPAPAIVVDYPLYQQNACGFNASATGQGNNNQGRSDCAGVSTGLQLPDNISMEAAVAASIRIQTLTRKRRAQKVVAHRRKLYGVGFKPSEIEEGVEGVGLSWADEMQPLHWDPRLERRGLGWQIRKLNHIGLVCADIGTSVAFYSDVIGLQQIHRPNFDRYGAWFTMGNVELHLTKGTPPTRSKEDDTDLITHHMAMEIHPTQVEMVKKKLQDMNVPFRQNLSVPRGDVQVKDGPDKSKFDKRSQLVQFIIRDPDGYYIEVLSGGDSLIDLCFPFLSSDGANEVQTIHYHDYDDPHQVPVPCWLVLCVHLILKYLSYCST